MGCLKSWRAQTCALLVSFASAGCCLLPGRDEATVQKSLSDVVDAIQLAVDAAAKDDVWNATQAERLHLSSACKLAKDDALSSCTGMLARADSMCQALCKQGGCGVAFEQRCKALSEGDGADLLCTANGGGDAIWCRHAPACLTQRATAANICGAAASIAVPSLKQATLTVAVERSRDASLGVDVIVVSFGASRSQVATNTVQMVMKPRVRDPKYQSDGLPPMPKVRDVSPMAKELASNLTQLIVNAVKATVKEYDEKDKSLARPPTALSDLTIDFSLVIDEGGKLGIKKTWEAADAGIELGGKAGVKATNKLTIQYARAE